MSRAYIFGSRVDYLIQDLFAHYVDEHGLVVQKNGDGGDSAYRTALAATILTMLLKQDDAAKFYRALIDNCLLHNFDWVRHPNKSEWWSDPKTFSADQAAKVMLSMLLMDDNKIVYYWLVKRMASFGFHQNTRRNDDKTKHWKLPDIIRPGEVSNLIRGLDFWVLYPLLFVLDFRFLFDLYFRKKTPWDYDSLMAIDLIYSQFIMPTPIANIAKRFYIRTDYKERIRNNYSDDNNGIYPLGELYIIACKAVLEDDI